MEDSKEQIAYLLAKHKTEKLRRFYMHIIIYLIGNSILLGVKIYMYVNNGGTFGAAISHLNIYSTTIIWGLVLFIHAFYVYGPNIILGDKWEEKKLRQYIKEEEEINNQ